jgi:hypothetical protein
MSGLLLQVCADTGPDDTTEREIRALKNAASDYPRARQRLLMLTLDQLPATPGKGLVCQPVYEWLLSENS